MARKRNDDGDILNFSESVGKFVVDHPWLTTSIVGTVVSGVMVCVRGYKPFVTIPTNPVPTITDKKKEEPAETPEEESFED